MLKIIKYNNKLAVEKYFQQMDAVHESWIIANLKTKQELQKKILKTKGFYLDTSVIRIRDFWIHFFNTHYPEYKIISNETYHILVKNILEKYKDQIQIQVIDYEKKCQDLNYFINLLLDPSFDLDSERFVEWLNQFERRQYQLKSSLLVNRLIVGFLLRQKSIPYEWVSSFLHASGVQMSTLKQNKIYFDLGSEISMKEAEFIYELSKEKEVIVFESEYAINQRYHFLLKPYEYLNSKVTKAQIEIAKEERLQPQVTLKKFSNSLAECRDVVGQVAEWISKGVSLEEIQILAPQIELYWPMLEPLFKVQGIPLLKNKVFKVISLPQLQVIFAKIRFYQRRASAADLEKLLFLNQSKSYCSYQEFKNIFSSPFYAFSDLLERLKENIPSLLANDFKIEIEALNLDQELSREEFFVKFAFLFEDHLQGEIFDYVLSELFKGSHESLVLSGNDWFEWLILSLQRLEVKIDAQATGVRIDSLLSSHSFNVKYVYVLGVDDTYFSNTHDMDIEPEDILSLASELGFYLDHPDYNFRAYELETVKERTTQELILSYALRDLKGEISNPSAIWQKLAFDQKITEKSVDLYKSTQWDEYQKASPELYFKTLNPAYDWNYFLKDHDLERYPVIATENTYNLSPSAVKSFGECSFKFYMQKELGMDDVDIEEIDISSKDKGLWYHRIYQLIVENWESFYREWKICDSESAQIILLKEKFEKEVPKTVSKNFWDKVHKRYYTSLIKFIEHETQLQEAFPSLQTLQCEAKWQIFYDSESQTWSKEKPSKGFLFKGTIDRVLFHKQTGRAWVIDYKLGAAQALSHGNWSKEEAWQLAFYTFAVEKGWLESLSSSPVELAQYWVVNKWKIKKGYIDRDQSLLTIHDKFLFASKKDLISSDEKQALLEKFSEYLQSKVLGIQERKYRPLPKDDKQCKKCQWSLTCRAPHLS